MPLFASLLLLAAPAATPAADTSLEARTTAAIEAASTAIGVGKPEAAVDGLAPIIAEHDAQTAREKRMTFCGLSLPESLLYMGMAAAAKRDGVAVGPTYCEALFLQGYALIDLGRLADARAVYQRLLTLAPSHAHYLTELGQTYRYDKNWTEMRDTCARAEGVAGLAGEDAEKREQGFALRCQGYALIELGKLDEAEKLYRKCLAIDPADEKATAELGYIAKQRGKKRSD